MPFGQGRPPIGPKVQSQVYPTTYEYIQTTMETEGRKEADVVRELIELGVEARRSRVVAGSAA